MRRCCTCKGQRAGAGERKSPPVTLPAAHNIPKFPPSSQQQPPGPCLAVGIAVCAQQHGPLCYDAGLGAGRWACSLGMSVRERWIVPDTWLPPLLIFSSLSLPSATSLFTGHPKPGWVKVGDSVAFSTFTISYNHHLCVVPKYPSEGNPQTSQQFLPVLPPRALGTHSPLSVTTDSPRKSGIL